MPNQPKRARRLRLLIAALVATSVSVVGAVGTASATPTTNPVSTGVLEICKVASGKDVAGTFDFVIERSGAQPRRVGVPADGCSMAITLPVGPVTVTELARPGYTLSGIEVDPRERGTVNLNARSAQVSIVAGGISNQTMVTFTNKVTPKGFLKLCKDKPHGDTLTGWFNFTVSQAGSPTIPLSIAVGQCRLIQLFAGEATVTEVERSYTQLVRVTSNRQVTVDQNTRTARVPIAAGGPATPTILTFINKDNPPPPKTGHVVICKNKAGPDVPSGPFTFTLGAGTRSVQLKPGECRRVEVPLGPLTITEKATNGLQVASIDVSGGAILAGPNTQLGTVTVRVERDPATLKVTFTNRVAPPGKLKVCKVPGRGVVDGTPFSFTVATRTGTKLVTVQAGSCSLPLTVPAGDLTVTENKPDGMTVTDIIVVGAGQQLSQSRDAATVRINVASSFVTEVLFINSRPSSPVSGCVWSRPSFTRHPGVIGRLVPKGGLSVGGDWLTASKAHFILKKAGYSKNYRFRLQGQLITTLLNQLSGASTPASVQTAVNAAQLLMSQGDGALYNGSVNNLSIRKGDTVTWNGRDYKAGQLMDTLHDYNRGAIHGCPNPCGRRGYADDSSKHRGSHGRFYQM